VKYTKFKLTDSMLQRLSAIVGGRPHNHGTSLGALEARRLVMVDPSIPDRRDVATLYPRGYVATDLGRQALADARREGW